MVTKTDLKNLYKPSGLQLLFSEIAGEAMQEDQGDVSKLFRENQGIRF
jgi:hypothetical protein